MNAMDYLKISNIVCGDCPKCGNKYLGNGQGSFHVEETAVKRTCKCGFAFEYDVKQGVDEEKIKKAINEAVNKN